MARNSKKGNIFGFEGAFFSTMEMIFDIFAVGFLWLLCCIPILTIGASTTAFYYVIVKCIKNKKGYVISQFFHSFKENLKPATLLWVIVVVVSFLMHLNIGILMEKTRGYFGLFFICFYAFVSILIVLASCYAFPALSRYDMPVGWIIKISLYMLVRYIGTTVAILLLLICMGGFVYRFPILIFFIPGPTMFLLSDFVEKILKKHEPQREAETE